MWFTNIDGAAIQTAEIARVQTRGARVPSEPSVVLAIEGLRKSFGGTIVLDDVAFTVREGEVLALIGSSGSGKSTLLRCIDALEEFDAGSILLDGEFVGYRGRGRGRRRLGDARLSAQRARIGVVFQGYNLFPHLTAERNITLGLSHVLGLSRVEAEKRAAFWLGRVGLSDQRGHRPYQLSGGQQQRVAIARAVAMQPRLLLLDEITSALDPELAAEVLVVVRDLAKSGTTMVIVSHELGFVHDVADRVAFLHAGRVVEIGPPSRVFAAPSNPHLASFVSRFQRGVSPCACGTSEMPGAAQALRLA